ncbi:hypothetical protein DPMN_125035 [Dreissena polymorpha]|uniref:Uncharacterized protein n=1 Tax=Dreissena polymorpha TaxID=45954 RepID=A0A9D4JT44_DREPO|nr:hypothetical protein DPMN_125035 [Dreissena polymorpha]
MEDKNGVGEARKSAVGPEEVTELVRLANTGRARNGNIFKVLATSFCYILQ